MNGPPRTIVIDRSGANTARINDVNRMLKRFGCLIPIEMVRNKHPNIEPVSAIGSSEPARVEQDHRTIKTRVHSMLGLKSFVSASATLEGIEVANIIRQRQLAPGLCPFAQFAALTVQPDEI